MTRKDKLHSYLGEKTKLLTTTELISVKKIKAVSQYKNM